MRNTLTVEESEALSAQRFSANGNRKRCGSEKEDPSTANAFCDRGFREFREGDIGGISQGS